VVIWVRLLKIERNVDSGALQRRAVRFTGGAVGDLFYGDDWASFSAAASLRAVYDFYQTPMSLDNPLLVFEAWKEECPFKAV